MLPILNPESGRISLGALAFDLAEPLRSQDLEAFLRLEAQDLAAAAASPGFAYSRSLYRLFQVDPTRHRPSSEALLRRLAQGLPFPRVTAVVDLVNRLSLRHMVPYGLYDRDKLQAPLTVRQGLDGDGYEGIRKGWLPLAGKIVLADPAGPFGNPSGDSLRGSVDGTSRRMLAVVFFHPRDPRIGEIMADSRDFISSLCGCQTETATICG